MYGTAFETFLLEQRNAFHSMLYHTENIDNDYLKDIFNVHIKSLQEEFSQRMLMLSTFDVAPCVPDILMPSSLRLCPSPLFSPSTTDPAKKLSNSALFCDNSFKSRMQIKAELPVRLVPSRPTTPLPVSRLSTYLPDPLIEPTTTFSATRKISATSSSTKPYPSTPIPANRITKPRSQSATRSSSTRGIARKITPSQLQAPPTPSRRRNSGSRPPPSISRARSSSRPPVSRSSSATRLPINTQSSNKTLTRKHGMFSSVANSSERTANSYRDQAFESDDENSPLKWYPARKSRFGEREGNEKLDPEIEDIYKTAEAQLALKREGEMYRCN
ncbi:hypothetical protein BGZ60DRAFT_516937 [Tricladium varicosporioides]|nr:hypothetical protein BGZ60DRAFT_516937 [Hymenoscyphus varicosporioides]